MQALPSPSSCCPHPSALSGQPSPTVRWGAEHCPWPEGLGCAMRQGHPRWSGSLGGTGWHRGQQQPGVLHWEPSLVCAHLFGLAEVGDVQGVDAAGVGACPAQLSTVLEQLLLPCCCDGQDGEMAEIPQTPSPAWLCCSSPLPLDALVPRGYFDSFSSFCTISRAGGGSQAARGLRQPELGDLPGWRWCWARDPPLWARRCFMDVTQGSFLG